MPIVAHALLVFALATLPQQEPAGLLSARVHMSGTVVDPAGNAIAGALVVHSNTKTTLQQTDDAGHFAFDTDAPAVVIQKPGFRSQRIEVRAAGDIRVTLHPFPNKLPTCTNPGHLIGMEFGSMGGLYFHPMKEIKATRPKMDVDYLARNYYIVSSGKKFAIWHGTGPMWGGSESFDEDVWRSTYFEEVYYSAELDSIIDARGQFPDGTRWRNVGELKIGIISWRNAGSR